MIEATLDRIPLIVFLAGPDRVESAADDVTDADLLVVDDVFGKDLPRIIDEARRDDPSSLNVRPDEADTRSFFDPNLTFKPIEQGVLLVGSDGTIIGAYLGVDVALDPAYRGRQLGAELILERYLRGGNALPGWGLDEAAYSRAGLAAHQAAWRLLDRPEIVLPKLQALNMNLDGRTP